MPGTTRDVLEEVLNIRGVPVRLLDTAGVRDTSDPVEYEGIRRSRSAMEQAELLLILLDGSAPLSAEDRELLFQCKDKRHIVVVNKTDLPCQIHTAELEALKPPQATSAVVWISAKTGTGLDELRDAIRTIVLRADFEPGETAIVTRLRHRASLLKAGQALAKAAESAKANLSGEFIALDLRSAVDALGEITGAVSTEDILDRIFNEFCIGK
ncbi:MAG: hypothetical protein C4293_06760 [Nitrospiraceae bacterium]